MFAGVPTITASAPSTSTAVAARAGCRTTVTFWICSSVAPATTASNIACSVGDGVWWTISTVGMYAILPRAPSSARSCPLLSLGRPAEGRAEPRRHVGEDLHVVLVLEGER